ncbi:MAG TPA: amidohydrolase family protein [Gemmata sp.]|nr:amidohydrolase family protein [Gemmata sp.]
MLVTLRLVPIVKRCARRALLAFAPLIVVATSLILAIGSVILTPTAHTAQPADTLPGSDGDPIVFFNATIYTGTDSAPIKNGFLAVSQGKIQFVGTKDEFAKLPKAAQFAKVDLKGAVIIPGLVDTHSHIGVYPRPQVGAHSDGNETSSPVQGIVRAIDSFMPDDPGIRMAITGGVTTANVMPGSANVIGGQTVYVKLRGHTIEDMRITGRLPDGTEILGGLKMANGENPKGYGKNKQQAPFTRMKVAALQRETFLKAREYQAKWKQFQAGGKGATAPDRDLTFEPLVEVLERKRTVHFHCHRADDLMTAIRIAEEFGFELVLQHATEGYRIADILAKKKIPASLTLIDSPGGKAETIGLLEENAAILEKAGVTVAINTDDFITESRFLLRTGAIAVRGGMSEPSALKSLTSIPAKLMHLDHRLGSLEAKKDADFVILSGAPFSAYTQVLATYIEGKKVFDRSAKRDWSYQAGGFALPDNLKELPAPYKPIAPPQHATTPVVKTTGEPSSGKKIIVLAGRIHTAAGPPIEKGAVLIEDGKIIAVMKADEVKIPADAAILTAAEVTPGLVDPFCVAGLTGAWNIPADQDQDELSDPNQADLRVLDGFNPREPLLEFLKATGVTVVHTTPGRMNPIAGRSGVFRTEGTTVESAALNTEAGLLVNLGEAPKETYKAKGPNTRMAVAGLVRKAFADAEGYRKKQPPGPKNPKLEALIPALEGKMPVYFAAHRQDDISTALRIAAEFKLKPVIALGTEAYRLADELKKAGVPVVVHPTMQRAASTMETMHGFTGNAAFLADKGVPITIGTSFEGYVPKVRVLRHEAIVAAASGLGTDRALKAVTIDAAKLLGIDREYGSIEKGKVADLVLYDGDPFEHTTHVTRTVMGGRVVYNRDDYVKLPLDRRILSMMGGPEVGCCMGTW